MNHEFGLFGGYLICEPESKGRKREPTASVGIPKFPEYREILVASGTCWKMLTAKLVEPWRMKTGGKCGVKSLESNWNTGDATG